MRPPITPTLEPVVRRATPLFFLIALVVGATTSPGLAEEVLVDGIAAQVGTKIVLLSDVQELARPVEERMREAGVGEAEIRNMHAEALERLIEAKLIEGVVQRLELSATEGEVDSAIMGIAQDTGLTIEQLQRSVESHGLAMQEYRKKLKGEIERSKVLNAMVRSRVRVDPEEVRAAYEERYSEQREGGEEIHLRHIMVAAGGQSMRSLDTACMIASDARRKIVSGEIGFPDMARRVTDMNPDKAGDLGWMHIDDMAGWMAGPVGTMKPGDVSQVIEMSFGCNVLELVDRRTFSPVTYAQVEQELTAELSRQEMDKAYYDWLDTVREQTFISRKGLYAEGGGERRGAPGTP
jgi:peptidyl-prolyl cis-trans isomerase SurA